MNFKDWAGRVLWWLMIIAIILCSNVQDTKFAACNNSSKPHNNLMKEVLSFSPFHKRNWGSVTFLWLFLTALEAGKSKIKTLGDFVSGDGCFLLPRWCVLVVPLQGRSNRSARQLSEASFIRTLIHLWGKSFHNLITPQKVSPLNTITLGIRFQHEFWRDVNIQTIADTEWARLWREGRDAWVKSWKKSKGLSDKSRRAQRKRRYFPV